MIWLRDSFNLNIQRLRKNTHILVIFAIRVHTTTLPILEYSTISHFDPKTKIYFNILASFWYSWTEPSSEALIPLYTELGPPNDISQPILYPIHTPRWLIMSENSLYDD